MISPDATAVLEAWARSRMLRARIVTAVIIAAAFLSLLFAAPPPVFAAIAAIIMLGIGGWEAGQLGGFRQPVARWTFGGLLLLTGLAAAAALELTHPITPITPSTAGRDQTIPQLLIAPALLWLFLIGWLSRPTFGDQASVSWRVIKLAVLAVILGAAWLALSWLQRESAWLVVMLIVIIAAADTGAYFTGRHFGGPKLAPRISPGKTWSGVAGGMVSTVVISALASLILPGVPFSPLHAAGIALVLAGISIGGDLFISLLKRQQGIKDSSHLLPGHGGILDRIDSLGAALPFFALAVAYLSA